jgi:hypothetical protein
MAWDQRIEKGTQKAEHPTTLLEPKLNFDVALLAHNQARFCICWLAAQHGDENQ